jgi:hypothetical protein
MAELTYHQMSAQHIRRLAQSNSPEPVALVQQVQDTEQSRRQQALAEIQALERQRLGLSVPDQDGEHPQQQ